MLSMTRNTRTYLYYRPQRGQLQAVTEKGCEFFINTVSVPY